MKLTKELFFSSNLIHQILDHTNGGINVVDTDGILVYVNNVSANYLNQKRENMIGKHISQFYPAAVLLTVLENHRPILDKKIHLVPPNKYVVNSYPIFMDGEFMGAYSIFQDIQEIDQLNSKIKHLEMQVSLTKPEADFQHVVHMGTMQNIYKQAKKIVGSLGGPRHSIITGESGTGKEVVAQFVHDSSPRHVKPLVVINCASLPENLLEAELFGYEKGAFTGAAPGGKAGLFEEADGGTLFLDEINSMPVNLQGKVLRAIETKTIQRIGATKVKKVDFRLLSATNEDLERLVEEKRFRPDLYYRLAVIPIRIPPLRERKADIIPLAQHFLNYFCEKYAKDKVFTQQTLNVIHAYDWPGNVRELKNFIERSVVMSMGRQIEVLDVSSFIDPVPPPSSSPVSGRQAYAPAIDAQYEQMLTSGVSLEQYLERCEREYVGYALRKFQNSYKAADALKTSQSSIMRRKKKYFL